MQQFSIKAFAEPYRRLDEATSTIRKLGARAAYFREAPAADATWTVSSLMGRKPRQVVPTRSLKQWAAEWSRVAGWLFEAS